MDRSVNTRALSLRPGQRLIAVSDIHGNLRLFNKLLDQVRYTPGSDVLVLAGDLIEKGPQSLDTLRFIMKLSKAPGVYALMGNCDFVCKNIWHRYNLRFLHQVLLLRKASILHEMADALHVSIDAHTDMERFCDLLHQHYAEELSWVDALPQVVYDDSCIFAHAGIMNETDFGSDFREVMTYPHFMLHAPEFTRWVIVGHMPVSEYCHDIARFHPLIDARRHIISIDGGNAVKHAGQLNALIMRDGSISWESVDELPCVRAARDIAPPNRDPLFITWRESAIRILKHGEDADFCEHLASGRKLWIAHEFIHAGKDDQLCADDFTSYQMPLQRGEQISLVRRYERFSIIKKDGILGWCRNADLIP